MAVPRPRRVTLLTLLVLFSVLVLIGSLYEAKSYRVAEHSPSPLNPLPGGTQLFYHELAREARVVLGGPDSIDSINGKILYIIIGIDKPFTSREADIIVRGVEEGKVHLLVADETGMANVLLERLGAGRIDGYVIDEAGVGEWKYVVPLYCGGESSVSTLVARLELGEGGTPVCFSNDNVVGALYDRGGLVLVVGDSSVFANFLYGGEYQLLPDTRRLAWEIVGMAGFDEVDVVVWDNAHYAYKPGESRSGILARLVGAVMAESEGVEEKLSTVEPGRLILYLLTASLPWPVILLFPSRREAPTVDDTGDFESWLVSLEAERLGAKTPGAPIKSDPARLARRLLRVYRGGDNKG